MTQKYKKIIRAKSISTKRFPFYPYISYLYEAVKNKLFTFVRYRTKIWRVGSWHQVDKNNTPFRGVRPIGGGG